MPDVNQEIEELLIRVAGTEDVKVAEAAFEQLQSALKTGTINFEQFEAATDQVDAKLAELRAEAARTAAATDSVGAAAGRAGRTAAGSRTDLNMARMGFLDISRAAQDLSQGGFPAILNNLEGIGRAIPAILKNPMALLSSLPTLLTLGGVAIYMFGGRIKELLASLDPDRPREFTDAVSELTKRVEELKKGGLHLAVDRSDLDRAEAQLARLKADKAEFDAAAKKQTLSEAEAGKRVQEKLTEAGLPAISAELKRKYIREQTPVVMAEPTRRLETAEAELKKAQAGPETALKFAAVQVAEGNVRRAREAAAGLRAGVETSAETYVAELFKQTREGFGEGQALATQNLARELTAIDRGELARQITAITPQTVAVEEAAKKRTKDQEEADRAAKKIRDAALKTYQERAEPELEALRRGGGIERGAAELRQTGEAAGLHGEALYQHVRDGLRDAITEALAQRGVRAPAGLETEAGKPVAAAAEQAAGQVVDDVTRAAATAAQATATAAEQAIDQIVQDYDDKLKDLATRGLEARAQGWTPEQVQAEIARRAQATIEGGGIAPDQAKAAAARIAESITSDISAQIAERKAELGPAPEPSREPGRARPGRPGLKAIPPRTPDQEAAAALAVEARTKEETTMERGDTAAQKRFREQYTGRRAQEVYQQSQFYTGQQFTPAQATDVAKRSIELQDQGLSANQATLAAMNEALIAMQTLANKLAANTQMANQLRSGFRQVARHTAEQQPSALNNLR